MQNEDIIVKLWEQSYTKGNFERVTVGDLKQFAQVCDKVNDDQNKVINENQSNIANIMKLIEMQNNQIAQMQSQIKELQDANKSN